MTSNHARSLITLLFAEVCAPVNSLLIKPAICGVFLQFLLVVEKGVDERVTW